MHVDTVILLLSHDVLLYTHLSDTDYFNTNVANTMYVSVFVSVCVCMCVYAIITVHNIMVIL